jgi:long-chain acyl-CoA synthetase
MNKSELSIDRGAINYQSIQSLPEIWQLVAAKFGNIVALNAPHLKPEVVLTYQELYNKIQEFAIALQVLGIQPTDKIALFADNSPRWFIADQGIMMAGAVDVVRSAVAEKQELLYIFSDSQSKYLVVENLETLARLRPELDSLSPETVILLSDETPDPEIPFKIINFQQLLAIGVNSELQPVKQDKSTLATLIYTSGTTGKPKGAMLSHGNLMHQVVYLEKIIQPQPGDRVLSILPSWHAYERSAEYFLLSRACTMYYTNLRSLKKDLQRYKPHYMVGVPRLWESIYEGVQKQFREQPANKQKLINFFFNNSQKYITARRIAQNFGLEHLRASASTRLKAKLQATVLSPIHALGDKIVYQKVRDAVGGNPKSLISGGGSLAKHLDDFYEIVNIPILVGYGLTETSPVTNARTLDRNFRKTAGKPLPETEIKIVDVNTGQQLSSGETGLVLIRGAQVMQGYYRNPEATAKAINPEGWFDSGDIGWVTPDNDLVLTGRAKDTIVLSNGENIEPQPIEDACLRSPYIDQIMLVGQDSKYLGALIVPNLDAIEQWVNVQQLTINLTDAKSVNNDRSIRELMRQELNREVQNRPGYRPDDRIGDFRLILEPFSQENGMMTQTLKIKRPVVQERYQYLIDEMYDNK